MTLGHPFELPFAVSHPGYTGAFNLIPLEAAMHRLVTWRALGWSVAITCMVVVLLLLVMTARWVIGAGLNAGLVAMGRVLRHGPTRIDDFKYYPGRRLRASATPYHFAEDGGSDRLPNIVTWGDGTQGHLEDLLSRNDTIAFLVIKDDTVIFERYYQSHTPASPSQAFSMSKSITSILVGMAIDDGYIQSVDQPVTDFVPELREHGFDEVTIRQLLTMTSAMDYVENDNPFGLHVLLNYTPDLEKMILDFRLRDELSRGFKYRSGETALVGLILDRALDPMTITEYAQERLWSPLGMEYDGVWTLDREGGFEKTWCCLAAAARDFAKLGRLYLHLGSWDGHQVVSEHWIEQSTRLAAVSEAAWPDELRAVGFRNYGYYWWLVSVEEGDYLALGKDGQFLYVNPVERIVIVRLGWSMGELPTSRWVSLFRSLAHEAS